MYLIQNTFRFAVCLMMTLTVVVFAQEGKVSKTFQDIKEVRISTVSGDCIIEKGAATDVKVEVTYSYHDDEYEPRFEEHGSNLILEEKFWGRNNRGRSLWKLVVPENTDIDFSTASGDFESEGLKSKIEAETASGNVSIRNFEGDLDVGTASGDVDGNSLNGKIEIGTASGDVELDNVSGDIKVGTASGRINSKALNGVLDLGTASGDIELRDSKGEFDVGAASGDIEAEGITLEDRSEFSAASGDVEVRLAQSSAHNLKVSTASGDALLDYNGNEIRGFIEMTAKAGRDRIRAPFEFDNEETYFKWDNEYVTKTVTRNEERPRILISTASGIAELRE